MEDRDTASLPGRAGLACYLEGQCCLRLFRGGFQMAGTESQPACVTRPRVGTVNQPALSCGCGLVGIARAGRAPEHWASVSSGTAHPYWLPSVLMCPCSASAGLTEIRCVQEHACVCAHTSGGLATQPCASDRDGEALLCSELQPTPVPEFPAAPAELRTDVGRFAAVLNRPPGIFPEETQKYFGVCSE